MQKRPHTKLIISITTTKAMSMISRPVMKPILRSKVIITTSSFSSLLKVEKSPITKLFGTSPAITAMNEAIRNAPEDRSTTFISDGNPSYPAGIHDLNQLSDVEAKLTLRKGIGLQNHDEESEEYRPFKQIIDI